MTDTIIGLYNSPVVNEGSPIFCIALFKNPKESQKAIKIFKDLHIKRVDPDNNPNSPIIKVRS